MRDLSVGQRIAASFLLVIAVMLATSVLFYLRADEDEDRATQVEQFDLAGLTGSMLLRTPLNAHIHETYRLVVEAQNSRKSVVTQAWRDLFAQTDAELDRGYTAYLSTISDPRDRAATAVFKTSLDSYRTLHGQLLDKLDRMALAEANSFANEQLLPRWNESRDALLIMMQVNEKLIADAMHGVRESASEDKLTVLVALVLALIISITCGWLLYRSITQPLQATLATMKVLATGDLSRRLELRRHDEFDALEQGFNSMISALRSLVSQAQRSAEQLSTSISAIATTAVQQQAAVAETAASAMQIGATSNDIFRTSRELVRAVGEVSGSAEQTANLAKTGQMGVARISEVMRQLAGAATMVRDRLALLSQKTSDANQMAGSISKLTEQTIRLSKKGMEAGNEGGAVEKGQGFGSLASDVRRLAEQSAVGTGSIERKLREIQLVAAEGVAGMDRFSEEVHRGTMEMMLVSVQLQQIIEQILVLAPRVQLVSEGVRAQSSGAEQINQALSQLTATSRQTVQALEGTNAAIQRVEKVARELKAGVSSFQV